MSKGRVFRAVWLTTLWIIFGPALSLYLFMNSTDSHGLPTGYSWIALATFALASGLYLKALLTNKSSNDRL